MNNSTIRSRGRENLRGHWGISIAAAFVASIFGALAVNSGSVLDLVNQFRDSVPPRLSAMLAAGAFVLSAVSLAQFVLRGVVQLGYVKFLLGQHDGTPYAVADLFSQFDRFSVGFLQSFLRGLYVVLWSLLLLIPGIIKNFSYAMTPFILADHPELKASEAIRRSMDLMQGHKMELFLLELSFIGWDILNIFTLGIGSFWLNPYKNAAVAAFYRELTVINRETYVEF